MISDSYGVFWELTPERITRGAVRDFPGSPEYRLYLRARDVGSFLRSGARAWFIPVFHAETDRVWGNYVISCQLSALCERRSAVAANRGLAVFPGGHRRDPALVPRNAGRADGTRQACELRMLQLFLDSRFRPLRQAR